MMALKINVRMRCLFAIFYCAAIGAGACYGQQAKAQIEGGIGELKKSLAAMKVEAAQSQAYQRLINRTEAALQSDKLLLSLVYLQQAWMNIRADGYSIAKADMAKQGIAGFDQEWKKIAREFNRKERLLQAKPATPQATAVSALKETALTLTRPYHQSSRLYALNASVSEALIYLGRAQAAMDFAFFCHNLQLPATGKLTRQGSIDTELKKLEGEIVEAYKQPDAAAKQRAYIQISVTLKTAEELNRETRFSGALVRYLDAILELTAQQAIAPDEQKINALKSQNETLRQRLSSRDTDASIGLIYAEMAGFLLAQTSAVEENSKRAAAIIDKVLPAYFNITVKEK